MSKHKVFISPSDQTANTYAVGDTNEAAVCGKIGAACQMALERCGFETKLLQYATMAEKCAASDAFGAELHIPIHTNAFNGKVSGTRLMCYALTGKGYKACKAIFDVLAPLTPGTSENISAHPELYEIRKAAAPTAYVEADFHDVPSVSKWLIAHTAEVGEAIAKGVCNYFGVSYVPESTAKEDNASAWSAEAREWAVSNGIYQGDGDGNFRWTDALTREEMAALLYRFAKFVGKA